MAFQNLATRSGISRPAALVIDAGTAGTCKLNLVLLNRKASGGLRVTE
jgi:hypothetical protein